MVDMDCRAESWADNMARPSLAAVTWALAIFSSLRNRLALMASVGASDTLVKRLPVASWRWASVSLAKLTSIACCMLSCAVRVGMRVITVALLRKNGAGALRRRCG